ncbi:MAG: RNA polymerase subunit sigma-70, partial [Clostridiales bacterium]|nr:RNA polymerase subunit sigma-70 [Clostridiales bacterium]
MTDEQILAAYLKRDEQAICESNAKYGSYCLAIAQRILQNQEDAKECVNDTWLRAWRAIPPERP